MNAHKYSGYSIKLQEKDSRLDYQTESVTKPDCAPQLQADRVNVAGHMTPRQ